MDLLENNENIYLERAVDGAPAITNPHAKIFDPPQLPQVTSMALLFYFSLQSSYHFFLFYSFQVFWI